MLVVSVFVCIPVESMEHGGAGVGMFYRHSISNHGARRITPLDKKSIDINDDSNSLKPYRLSARLGQVTDSLADFFFVLTGSAGRVVVTGFWGAGVLARLAAKA